MGNKARKVDSTTVFAALEGGFAPKTLRRLIEAGADVNRTGPDGRRPLHLAAQEGNASLCSLLIRAGADTSLPDGSGLLPLDVAAGPKTRLALTQAGHGGGPFLAADPAGRAALRRDLLLAFDGIPDEALAGFVEEAKAAAGVVGCEKKQKRRG